MGARVREIEVGLKSPSVEGLNLVEEVSGNSAGDIRESGLLDSMRGEKDCKKDRRLPVRIGADCKAHVTDLARVERLRGFGHSVGEL